MLIHINLRNRSKPKRGSNLGQPVGSSLIDLGKVSELTVTKEPPVPQRSLVEYDLGEKLETHEHKSLLPSNQPHWPAMIDLGKVPEVRQTLPPPPVRQTLAIVDLGKSPDNHQSVPIPHFSWLVAGSVGIAVLGLLVVTSIELHQRPSRPKAANFPVVPYAVDERDAINLSPAELQPLQMWSHYGDRIEALAPGSSPNDPWWKIADDAHLSADRTEEVHKLQTDVLVALNRVDQPVSGIANGTLILIIAAKNQLQEQQTPPSFNLGPNGTGLPPPVRDLAGFYKPSEAVNAP